ncbi:MAG: hypothetical protein ABL888_21990 [Pirellulaceae bacterium]
MIETFLREIVDYAGLFPPAGLDMASAVRNFSEYRSSKDRWMLGRFVVPASRLGSLYDEAVELAKVDDPWPLSVLVPAPTVDSSSFAQTLAEIEAFNAEHPEFIVDSIETKIESLSAARDAAPHVPASIRTYWEFAADDQLDARLEWLRSMGTRHAAKVRTGGVEASMIPSAAQVASFIRGCVVHDVPFKATAGLHHPIRSEYPLTYEPNAKCAEMFGFLNVFVAAFLAKTHLLSAEQIANVLQSKTIAEFTVTDERLGWGKWFVEPWAMESLRKDFATSFGSCSFEEPANELRMLGLLPLHQLS